MMSKIYPEARRVVDYFRIAISNVQAAGSSIHTSIYVIQPHIESIDRMVHREWYLLTDHPVDLDPTTWLGNRRRLYDLRNRINKVKDQMAIEVAKVMYYNHVSPVSIDEACRLYDAYIAEVTATCRAAIDTYERSIVALLTRSGPEAFKKEVPGEPFAAPTPQST